MGWLILLVVLLFFGKKLWSVLRRLGVLTGGVNRQEAARLSKSGSSADLYEYLCRFNDAQHIEYIRGITDHSELVNGFITGAFAHYKKATKQAHDVAQERLDNECPKCGSREKMILRTFAKTEKQFETETRMGSKHHHYSADGDYKGYTEDEEEIVVEKMVTWAYDERKCGKCGEVWERFIGKG